MSQVDGSISVKFTGTSNTLQKLEEFMEENLSNFRSFSDYDVAYDEKNQKLISDVEVNEQDIFYFLCLVVANVPEVGFTGETSLSFVGSGGEYYGKYDHKAGDSLLFFEEAYDDDMMDEGAEFSLELKYDSDDDDKIEKFLSECPIPLVDESEQDMEDYYDGKYFVYESYSGELLINGVAATTEQMKMLIEAFQNLSAEVPSLEGNACYLTLDTDLIIMNFVPGKGMSSCIVPVNYQKSTYFG